MVDPEKLRAVAPHICWNPVGCDTHFCSLDKGHTVDCFSLHLSPCNIDGNKPFDDLKPKNTLRQDIKETIIDHFNVKDEEFVTVSVPTFGTKIEEHTCERLLEKENYGNYYMIHKSDFGWVFKTGMEAHNIFNCPYCGVKLE